MIEHDTSLFENHKITQLSETYWRCKTPEMGNWSFDVSFLPGKGIVLAGEIYWQIIEYPGDPDQLLGTDRRYIRNRMQIDVEEKNAIDAHRYKQWILGLRAPHLRYQGKSIGNLWGYGAEYCRGKGLIDRDTARQLWDKAKRLDNETDIHHAMGEIGSIAGLPDEWFRDTPFIVNRGDPKIERQIDALLWFLNKKKERNLCILRLHSCL
jgi:hypothetical protein